MIRRSTMTRYLVCLLALFGVISFGGTTYATTSTVLATSDFHVWGDLDNWRVVGIIDSGGFLNPPTIQNTLIPHWDDAHNGNLYDADHNYLAPNPDEYWFSAPAKFLGAKPSAYQGTLAWDIRAYTDGVSDTGLILVGASYTLYYAGMSHPTDGVWTHYNITLDSTDTHWRLNSPTGAAPTAAQWKSVLGNLKGMYILGDWLYGPDQTQIDNVVLTGITPEPGTLALLLMGGAALLRRRRGA